MGLHILAIVLLDIQEQIVKHVIKNLNEFKNYKQNLNLLLQYYKLQCNKLSAFIKKLGLTKNDLKYFYFDSFNRYFNFLIIMKIINKLKRIL